MLDIKQSSNEKRQGPRVVLAHDWLTGFRGGERCLDALCERFPEAPLYTLIREANSTSARIENRAIHTSFLNAIPGIANHYRKFLPLFPLAADTLKITEPCDVLLSSHHCVIKGVRKPKGSVHVSYVYSPMRYMYDQFENYFGAQAPASIRWAARACRPYLVRWDRASNDNVDQLVAISQFVRSRIQKFYQRDAEVVYPFVDFADFRGVQQAPPAKQDFYLMVSAFAPNKRVDLAIEAFNRLKLPLRIIGGGQQDKQLRQMAGPTIEFLGEASRETVVQNMASARAFIFPGVEDFGITPLESLAAGTPVIAFRAGGVLETLTDDDTLFFNEPTVDSLMGAVRSFGAARLCARPERLQVFSRERFQNEMVEVVRRTWQTLPS